MARSTRPTEAARSESYAARLGLDVARFTEDLREHVGANRIAHTLSRAVHAAGARASLTAA